MRVLRTTAAGVVVGAVGAVVALAVGAGGSHSPAARAAPGPLRVTSILPGWRAPGVPVTVAGFAAARERVVVRAGGRVVGVTTSGRLGRFHVGFAEARPGRFPVTIAAGGRSRRAGMLVVRPVVVDAVGDITFGEQVGPALAADGAAAPWRFVGRTLRRADITTGNLETSVSTRGVAANKKYTFRGLPAALTPVHALAGFDVLTLANNHAVDYGRDALVDTVRSVHAAGMQTIGAGRDSVGAHSPAIVARGGLRVAFLGYSDVNPPGFTATSDEPGTAAADVAAIETDVRAARRRADVVVCFFHWGTELHPDPDGRQVAFATACLKAGGQLVLGAHPHVLGPLVRPTWRTLVAWTLGNFVFPSSGETARTAILRVELDRRGVSAYRLLPVRIEGFTPHPAAG